MSEMRVNNGPGREKIVHVDYPANSKRSKTTPPPAEEKKIDKIVTGEVKRRKAGLWRELADSFISDDSGSVVSYVVMEVMLPAAKNMISDMVSQGVERALFGGDTRSSGSSGRPGYTNYSTTSRDRPTARTISRQARAAHRFEEIILTTRDEAEDVLDKLRELISQYEVATVSDLYDLVGITGDFTDVKWGWFDLRDASVRLVSGGYLLRLPPTQPIT